MHAKPDTQVNRINFCDECDSGSRGAVLSEAAAALSLTNERAASLHHQPGFSKCYWLVQGDLTALFRGGVAAFDHHCPSPGLLATVIAVVT
jgi:hypothetical protein